MSIESLPYKAVLDSDIPLEKTWVRYRTLIIKPKLDFGVHGYLIKGVMVKEGWIVSDGYCNVMPAATWFQTIDEAKHAIDVLIAVKGDGQMFWEIMHPFKYTPGDKVSEKDSDINHGRHYAIIRNHVVIEVGIHNPDDCAAPKHLQEAHA